MSGVAIAGKAARLLATALLFALGWSSQVHAHGDEAVPMAGAKHQPGAAAPAAAPPVAASGGGETAVAAGEGDHADEENVMLHPGVPEPWIIGTSISIFAVALWALFARLPSAAALRSLNLASLPLIGRFVRFFNGSPYPLLAVKLVSVAGFLLVIYAGLFGTPYPERSLATTFVWNLWWPLVVVSVLFLGTAWCAICPWDTLSSWIVRLRLWRRASPHPGLQRKVPPYLQNVWLALLLFVALAWLEVGIGVTAKPFATALMALAMLVLSISYLLVFERKAFCRYACPVGRTLGFYARLAPISVRPVNQETCATCKTLECYHGSKDIEPCPTSLVVGRFSQNTNCLSCGNCMQSCPHKNVSWRLRPLGSEAIDQDQARPQMDGAWFMLLLLGITTFHGLTMMPFWGEWVLTIANAIGETGKSLASFTLAMFASFGLPLLIYASAVGLTWVGDRGKTSYKELFTAFSFSALPLAFVYHLAHNLDHLSRESVNVFAMLLNPLGAGLARLSPVERHNQMMDPLFPDELMFTAQSGLVVLGFWLAVQIIRHRGRDKLAGGTALRGWRLLPMLAFVGAITAMNLWLMAHEMEMRF
ncbi:MAG: 4Fe-4S binding protein [Sulfuritalea sp.]|jgi:ferredoxin|nr:4Fe-4S binding protein [Sulfuritalea sp.]